MRKQLAFTAAPTKIVMCNYLAFTRASNSNCKVKFLAFKGAPSSNSNCASTLLSKGPPTATSNPVPYFSKHSIQSYAALLVAVANASKPQLLLNLSLMLSFYRTNVWNVCGPDVFAHLQCGLEPRNLDGTNLGNCWCLQRASRFGQREFSLP